MSIERWAHSVTYLRDELLIVTGTTFADQLSKKAECYIIDSNHWQMLPDLNEGRAGHASCGFRARSVFVFCGFVITGSSYQATNSIEMLDIFGNGGDTDDL